MDCKISVKINGAASNSEYSSDKYHQLGVNDKNRDNYFMYMTRKELMNYFYPEQHENHARNDNTFHN